MYLTLTEREAWALERFSALSEEEQTAVLALEEAVLQVQSLSAGLMARATDSYQ